jgi:hypothetical protein
MEYGPGVPLQLSGAKYVRQAPVQLVVAMSTCSPCARVTMFQELPPPSMALTANGQLFRRVRVVASPLRAARMDRRLDDCNSALSLRASASSRRPPMSSRQLLPSCISTRRAFALEDRSPSRGWRQIA